MPRRVVAVALLMLACAAPAFAKNSVYIEELTWTEVRDAIKAGKTTVIFPTGGSEQNGPHMVIGKNYFIVHYAAGEIARQLGNALVGPVLSFVPEGTVDPPTGSMKFPGAITLPNEYFMKVTEWAARSFKANGFKDIVLIGSQGATQPGLKAVADLLNKEWAGSGTRVHFVPDYYRGYGFDEWLMTQGEKKEDIEGHGGLTSTAELMGVDPSLVRKDKFAVKGGYEGSGVEGNPTHASVAYGKKGLEMRIAAAVKQIKALEAAK